MVQACLLRWSQPRSRPSTRPRWSSRRSLQPSRSASATDPSSTASSQTSRSSSGASTSCTTAAATSTPTGTCCCSAWWTRSSALLGFWTSARSSRTLTWEAVSFSSSSCESDACISTYSTVSSSDSFAGAPPGYAKQIENSVSGFNHVLKPTAKSRDPRLRFVRRDPGGVADANRHVNFSESNASKDVTMCGGVSVNDRKHKAVDEPLVDENLLKRSRGGVGNLRDCHQQVELAVGWAKDGGNITSYSVDGFQPNQNTRLGNNTAGNLNLRTDEMLVNNINNNMNSSGTITAVLQAPQTNSAPQTSSAPARFMHFNWFDLSMT